jgi:hypothetical protein
MSYAPFEQIGLELFAEPGDGMFVWARFPLLRIRWPSRKPRSARLARSFRPHLERSPWMRFNVAVCEDTRVQRWLQRQAANKAT